MGCDIHLYVERFVPSDMKWYPVAGPNPEIRYVKSFLKDAETKGKIEAIAHFKTRLAGADPECYEGWAYDGRNYELFALLANVRNYDNITPLSMPKGLPSDVSDLIKAEHEEWHGNAHSESYLTLEEILLHNWDELVLLSGVVTEEEYKTFKETGRPVSYCMSMGGPKVKLISPEEMECIILGTVPREEGVTYTAHIKWVETERETSGIDGIIRNINPLGPPDQVRIVFWFDN